MSNHTPTETPNIVVENPKTRIAANVILGTASLILGTAIVIDGASPEFDISAYTLPASAAVVYLSGAFGFGVTIPNIPRR